MEAFVAKHAAKIPGTLSCFDRVLFRGYLPLMNGSAMAELLKGKQIDRWKLKPFLLEQAEFEGRPQVLAEALAHRIACPDLLAVQAHAMAEHAIPDAAARLADLVEETLAHRETVSQEIRA